MDLRVHVEALDQDQRGESNGDDVGERVAEEYDGEQDDCAALNETAGWLAC